MAINKNFGEKARTLSEAGGCIHSSFKYSLYSSTVISISLKISLINGRAKTLPLW